MAVLPVAQAAHFARKVSLDVTSVAASTVVKETFTVAGLTGLKTDRLVLANKPTDDTGLAMISARCNAADEVELTFWNYTGDAIDPAAQDFFIVQL